MVRLEWLEELFPDHVRRERLTRYDESRRRVIGTTRLWYHDLLLREDVNPSVELRRSRARPGRGPAAPGGGLVPRQSPGRHWLARLDFVRRAVPELNWPDFDDDVFAELLEIDLPGKIGARQVEQADLIPFLAKPAHSSTDPRAARERPGGARDSQRPPGPPGL